MFKFSIGTQFVSSGIFIGSPDENFWEVVNHRYHRGQALYTLEQVHQLRIPNFPNDILTSRLSLVDVTAEFITSCLDLAGHVDPEMAGQS